MGNIWYAEKWLKSLKDRVQPQPKYEWKQENTDALTDFENVMMHIGISFFGQHAGLDPNDTSAIKEQANILLGLVPKQEWSEKDEEMFDAIIADIQFTQKTHNHEVNQVVYEREIDWLKSLKDRVQPKQEWSEEDKGNLLDVKCIIDEIWHCQYIRGEIDRSCEELESLWSWLDNIWQKLEYPSSTWKPSEEQIRALEYQVHSTYQGSWQYKASKELLEQLKKL